MSRDISTEESVRDPGGPGARALHWLILTGNRHVVAAALAVLVVATTFVLIRVGLLAIGPSSTAGSLLASGIASGTLTLITVALSINQLILSRVFGSPDDLSDRLEGTRNLRERVRSHADADRTPSDPASFLSMLAETLQAKGDALADAVSTSDWDAPAEVTDYAEGIRNYGESIDDRIESQNALVDVLDVILGTEYAHNLIATEHVANAYGDEFSADAEDHLDAIDDLLEALAVTRQFFKTLSLQQDLAHLSRIIAYTGFGAVVVVFWLTLLYRSNSLTIARETMPVVFSLGLGVIVAPLTVFIAYILRAATIARRTVSVGPFVPPEEREN
jgi:hypothetical protein